jgi:hypothetical protein
LLPLKQNESKSLDKYNELISKAGISLAALVELETMPASMHVYLAIQDHEPVHEGYLHFNKGQTIYIPDTSDFVTLVKNCLGGSFIPYNRDRQGRIRASKGFIPYTIYLSSLQIKPREEWTAEDICNAIIIPKTAPLAGKRAKPYVDQLPENQRGKPFEGYILSYARVSKFKNIVDSLNERFKDKDPNHVFIWVDLAGINQHAWMTMKSEEIGRILEISLVQLFTQVNEGRLIHFDKVQPTNLTRSWCLMELLSCLKLENSAAQTEICMTSKVQSEVLAQDLELILNSLDSSKAKCFNPQDKEAIDNHIKKALINEGEVNITMETAYARLNNVVKSWLIAKFLPAFGT